MQHAVVTREEYTYTYDTHTAYTNSSRASATFHTATFHNSFHTATFDNSFHTAAFHSSFHTAAFHNKALCLISYATYYILYYILYTTYYMLLHTTYCILHTTYYILAACTQQRSTTTRCALLRSSTCLRRYRLSLSHISLSYLSLISLSLSHISISYLYHPYGWNLCRWHFPIFTGEGASGETLGFVPVWSWLNPTWNSLQACRPYGISCLISHVSYLISVIISARCQMYDDRWYLQRCYMYDVTWHMSHAIMSHVCMSHVSYVTWHMSHVSSCLAHLWIISATHDKSCLQDDTRC
jgi:hypothetical protein